MTRKPVAVSINKNEEESVSQTSDRTNSRKAGTKARKPKAVPASELPKPIEADPFDAPEEIPIESFSKPSKSGLRWGALFFGSISLIVSIGLGLWTTQLIEDLFARNSWLGWAGLTIVSIAGLSLVALIVKEILALMRLRRLGTLREEVLSAGQDGKKVKKLLLKIADLYRQRDDMDWPLSNYVSHESDIVDPQDRLTLFEKTVMAPLDREAVKIITTSAKRVSVITAVNPAPALDILFVGFQVLSLLRKLSALYGSRPGSIGAVRLARMVASHLAVTGGLAVSDTFIQQFLGHGLAGRLSAKLGEGTVNGIMTARIGLAAMDLARPMPFAALERPGLMDLVGSVFGRAENTENDKG